MLCTGKGGAGGQQEQPVCQSSRRVVTELPRPAHCFPVCPAESQPEHCFQISQSKENQRCVEAEDSKIWR